MVATRVRPAVRENSGGKTGAQPEPRHEFRMFGTDLARERRRLQAFGVLLGAERRNDVYLLIRGRPDIGLKLRETALDLKLLDHISGRFEMWQPVDRAELPLSGKEIASRFLSLTELPDILIERTYYQKSGLVAAIAELDMVEVVKLTKERQRYAMGEDFAEFTDLRIVGFGMLQTCSLEGTDPNRLESLLEHLEWSGPNLSYPRRMCRLAFSTER